jgi:hypothetical protein
LLIQINHSKNRVFLFGGQIFYPTELRAQPGQLWWASRTGASAVVPELFFSLF